MMTNHVSMNQMSINGPIERLVRTPATPELLLTQYVELYLGWCHSDIMEEVCYGITGQLGHIVQCLFDKGGDVDVTSYFHPMHDFYPRPFYIDTHMPDMPKIGCMKRYLRWQRRNFERGISGFGWVIDELEARKPT